MPDTYKISEFTTASQVKDEDYVELSQADSNVSGGRISLKTTILAIANKIATAINFSGLSTTSKNLVGAINEAASAGGSDVEVTNTLTPSDTLQRIATVTVDEDDTDIYADDAEKVVKDMCSDKTYTGNPVTVESVNGGKAKSCEIAFGPVQAGSGDPSPENVRSITGWNGLSLYQAGVNLANTTIYKQGYVLGSDGSETVSANYCITDKCIVTGGKKYVLRWKENGGTVSDNVVRIGWYKSNGDFISRTQPINTSPYVTAPANAAYCKLSYNNNSETDNYKWDIMLNEGETALDYVPYQGQTHTATFTDTVYGGKYDFVSGGLTVGKIGFEFDGSADESWSLVGDGTTNRRFILNTEIPMTMSSLSISNYLVYSSGNSGEWGTYTIASNTYIGVKDKDSNFQSLSEFTDYLSSNPLQIVCDLITPQEIPLSAEQIALLKGQNVLWSDSNGNITLTAQALEFLPDTGTDIPFKTATAIVRPKPGETNGDHIQISTDGGTTFEEYYYNNMNGQSNAKNLPPFFRIWYASPYWYIQARTYTELDGEYFFPQETVMVQEYDSMYQFEISGIVFGN